MLRPSRPHERLDRATLVHGGVGLGDPLEVGLEVEDPAVIDPALSRNPARAPVAQWN